MIKSKALMILLILFIFTAVISLSAGANHDSETPSIYNQTDNNSDVSSMSDSTDNNSSLSVYHSTDGNSMNMSAHSTDGNPANVSSYNWTFGETEGPLQPIEFKKVPIDEAYSRD
ncbi:MAG: hypothetical protein LBU81_05335, partial [Methanosarcinales archaeon]|nr:hypothetical protein [Methanosarcinales archaeon]